MKTIIQKTVVLFMVAVALGSCTRNDDINPDGDLPGDLLLTESKVDGELRARYDYDAQNRLVKLYTHHNAEAPQTTIAYIYNNNGHLTWVEMVNSDGESEYNETYTYENGNHPVSSKTVFGQDIENAIITTYTYAENKVVETANIPGGYTSEITYTTDEKGNLLSIETSSQEQWVSTTLFGDYDNKHAAGRGRNPYSWKFNSPNNHQSEKTTASYDTGNRDRILKYTYNNHGYPTKMEVYNREDNSLVETHTYTYKAAN
ncbi:hypothetical protein FXV77_03960 [Sphingobacterium phlebotomi]|uniref:YD repeat-containing protein n=1 Tax=Sphingobacterium phlebotomi TaxID=2605433 RepID=A0A5D4HDJ1_9SPHI|nr:hypothetical protein [Sphingobacterium phlebotomi]TYR38442.1 hypothetical protein FXV77_03960 [Sphingobacterium phlebotomi]